MERFEASQGIIQKTQKPNRVELPVPEQLFDPDVRSNSFRNRSLKQRNIQQTEPLTQEQS